MPRTKTDFVPFQLRMPPGMHADLTAAAAASGLSLNAEILSRLLKTLDRRISDYIARTTALDEEERRAREYVESIRDPDLKKRMAGEIGTYMQRLEKELTAWSRALHHKPDKPE